MLKQQLLQDFRQDFEFIKVREMNDLHHAKDAYLNVICRKYLFRKIYTKCGGIYKK